MKSFDFIKEDKIEELKTFCQKNNPPILLQIESNQKQGNMARVISDTDIHTMVKYDEHLYFLNNGTERLKYMPVKEEKKRWYNFLS